MTKHRIVCVMSSANECPARDFNEWMEHVYGEARKNYFKQIKPHKNGLKSNLCND